MKYIAVLFLLSLSYFINSAKAAPALDLTIVSGNDGKTSLLTWSKEQGTSGSCTECVLNSRRWQIREGFTYVTQILSLDTVQAAARDLQNALGSSEPIHFKITDLHLYFSIDPAEGNPSRPESSDGLLTYYLNFGKSGALTVTFPNDSEHPLYITLEKQRPSQSLGIWNTQEKFISEPGEGIPILFKLYLEWKHGTEVRVGKFQYNLSNCSFYEKNDPVHISIEPKVGNATCEFSVRDNETGSTIQFEVNKALIRQDPLSTLIYFDNAKITAISNISGSFKDPLEFTNPDRSVDHLCSPSLFDVDLWKIQGTCNSKLNPKFYGTAPFYFYSRSLLHKGGDIIKVQLKANELPESLKKHLIGLRESCMLIGECQKKFSLIFDGDLSDPRVYLKLPDLKFEPSEQLIQDVQKIELIGVYYKNTRGDLDEIKTKIFNLGTMQLKDLRFTISRQELELQMNSEGIKLPPFVFRGYFKQPNNFRELFPDWDKLIPQGARGKVIDVVSIMHLSSEANRRLNSSFLYQFFGAGDFSINRCKPYLPVPDQTCENIKYEFALGNSGVVLKKKL